MSTPPNLKGEPLFSEALREYVEGEFDHGRGRHLNRVKQALKRRSGGPGPHWEGNILDLHLDTATNLLTVSVSFAAEIEPEVVDYEEFKKFVLRERP